MKTKWRVLTMITNHYYAALLIIKPLWPMLLPVCSLVRLHLKRELLCEAENFFPKDLSFGDSDGKEMQFLLWRKPVTAAASFCCWVWQLVVCIWVFFLVNFQRLSANCHVENAGHSFQGWNLGQSLTFPLFLQKSCFFSSSPSKELQI